MDIRENKNKSRKKLWLFLLPLFAFALVAAVLIANLDTTIVVSEALSTASAPFVLNTFAGGTQCQIIAVENQADWDLWVDLIFTEISNTDSVDYTTDMPKTVTLASGNNNVEVCATVTPDSPNGTVNGTIIIQRVAGII